MDLIHSSAFAIHVNELLQQWHTPGLAIAVVQNSTVAAKGFGLATLDPPRNVTPDSLFDIASSSKSLTAASVGILAVDDLKYPYLQWDTPMSYLLPEDFVMSGEGYTEQVTVEDILSHRSGIPGHDYSYLNRRATHPDTPQSVTKNLRNLQNAAPLRTKFMYSNLMYIVASWLVEEMTALSFSDFLHRNFFEPLGMDSTHLQPNAAIDAGLKDRIATPYVWEEETQRLRPISVIQAPEAQGCGSIFTSVNDYIKWIRALMNQEPPISDDLYHGLLKVRWKILPENGKPPDGPPAGYAAGLDVQYFRGIKVVAHGGLVSGFHSVFFFLPEFKFGAVLLGNAGDDNVRNIFPANKIAIEILKEFLKDKNSDGIALHEQKQYLFSTAASEKRNLKQGLCPEREETQLQDVPLRMYTGRYCNSGYHCLEVSTESNALFIDATDRSEAFTVRFEHLCNYTIFIAHVTDHWGGSDDGVPAEFEIANGEVVRMGILFEDELEEYVWFDRMLQEKWSDQVVVGVA